MYVLPILFILGYSENGSGHQWPKTIRSSLWVSCAGPAQLKSRQELMDQMQRHDSLMVVVTAMIGHASVRPGAAVLRFRYGKLWGSKRKQTSRKESGLSVTCDPTLLQHAEKPPLSFLLPKPAPRNHYPVLY